MTSLTAAPPHNLCLILPSAMHTYMGIYHTKLVTTFLFHFLSLSESPSPVHCGHSKMDLKVSVCIKADAGVHPSSVAHQEMF